MADEITKKMKIILLGKGLRRRHFGGPIKEQGASNKLCDCREAHPGSGLYSRFPSGALLVVNLGDDAEPCPPDPEIGHLFYSGWDSSRLRLLCPGPYHQTIASFMQSSPLLDESLAILISSPRRRSSSRSVSTYSDGAI